MNTSPHPTGPQVIRQALSLLGTPYARMDCQALVRQSIAAAGGERPPKGVNTLMRSDSIQWWGTLENARARGMLAPGAALLIHSDDGGEPARYRGDGMGNFSHIGLYAGENALTDTGADGRARACDVIHSSQTLGRVAGSTLRNGWTHVAWLREIDYGREISPGVTLGAEAMSEERALPEPEERALPAPEERALPAPVDVSGFYTVRRGCRGGAVRRLQAWLIALGYNVGPHGADGVFGPATQAAVLAFQGARGLAADGVVGQGTWAALSRRVYDRSNEQEVLE